MHRRDLTKEEIELLSARPFFIKQKDDPVMRSIVKKGFMTGPVKSVFILGDNALFFVNKKAVNYLKFKAEQEQEKEQRRRNKWR